MATEKETTAPIPSVAPDGEQPSALARTDSITEIEETLEGLYQTWEELASDEDLS